MNKLEIQESLAPTAIAAAIEAGLAIIEVYGTDIQVEMKKDHSPLTIADKRANDIITKALEVTGLPILSEEGRDIPYEERKDWDYYWLVDPLDGTKEFIKRNGEFTVNIALMKGHQPVYGVIYVPVRCSLYFGGKSYKSYKVVGIDEVLDQYDHYLDTAAKLPIKGESRPYTVIASRSHMSDQTKSYIEEVKKKKGNVVLSSVGSSMKLCMIAEGRADEYPRFAPTMEWDTGAGQAIIEGAGGKVYHYESGKELMYNKKNLLNDWFLATKV
ncbi:MAG: 3'(2'),5'-bisphosphate nucleotidase CysQ [Vicingaceae bacterium]